MRMDFVNRNGAFVVSLALAVVSCIAGCSSSTQNGFPGIGGSGSSVGGNGGSGAIFQFGTGGSTAGANGYKVVDAGPYCGDGVIDTSNGEDCDDNNRIGGDGCSGICKTEPNWKCPTAGKPCESLIVCGNSVRQTGEGCDDGNKTPGDGCDVNCNVESGWYCAGSDPNDPTSKSSCQALAHCGDGRVTTGESCDLGTANGTGKGCDASCKVEAGYVCRASGCIKISVCGNGKVESGEECDDNNTEAGDGCSNTCKVEASYYDCTTPGVLCKDTSRCGNGALEKLETCDDTNTVAGDGCSATCTVEAGWQCRMPGKACVPFCGDRVMTATEACDDGNATSGDGCSSTCQIEPGSSCTTASPSVCTKSICGNGALEPGENCDAGKSNGLFYGDGKGCSKTCTKEPTCRNVNGVTGPCSHACGDGNKDTDEQCDDGNQVSGDGCSATCKSETGFVCVDSKQSDATPCPSNPALSCLVLPITFRDFDGQNVSGGHPDFFYYGAAASGGRTTGVVPGGTTTTCVPNSSGTKLPWTTADACPTSDQTGLCLGLVSNTLGADGKPVYAKGSCPCVFTDWDNTGILGSCPASGTGNCTPNPSMPSVAQCWVTNVGNHHLRVDTTVTVIQSADTFKQWYTDSTFSTKVLGTLELAATGAGYQFSSSRPGDPAGTAGRTVYDDLHDICLATPHSGTLNTGFFPLEAQTRAKVCNIWPYWKAGLSTNCCAGSSCPVISQWDPRAAYDNCPTAGTGGPVPKSDGTGGLVTGMLRNFYMTSEVRYLFHYDGTPGTLQFYGDDDVWVFINGNLALDLGGSHERLEGTATVGTGLVAGNTYEIAVFHADTNPRESNYQLTLSGFSTTRSVCQPRCGDGIVTAGEECDNGAANSDTLYNGCTTSCKFGPFCGDATKNGSEDCDDGKNTTVTASTTTAGTCGPGCKFPPRCGDGAIQAGEECDDGVSNANAQCGGCSTTCKQNAYCGDANTDATCGEQCDDGVNIGGYSYCAAGCKWDARCGDSVTQTAFGETCDLGAQNGVAGSGCTASCGVPAVCGDGVVQTPETCDNGVNDGTYGGCTSDCQHAPYCGDGAKNGSEECDYGTANAPLTSAPYGSCLENCKLGPRCGDGVPQAPQEKCDLGANNGPSSPCSADCIVQVPAT